MPKQKTNKALAKRVKVTGRGKLRRHRTGAGHLKSVKSPKRIRRFRKETELSRAFQKHARRLLGM
ncbi:MAG TPA: bL35 family ribosomal protein [Phycisphaerae bacterium]|nr:bL35 family ribosomal protein [Phycisphaerae bacterium]